MDEYESLCHTKWDCKYHVIFIAKCRRKTMRELTKVLGRSVPAASQAEAMPDWGGPPDAGPRTYDNLDSTQTVGIGGSGIHQGQECDPSCARVWRTQAGLCRPALLGTRVHGVNGGP